MSIPWKLYDHVYFYFPSLQHRHDNQGNCLYFVVNIRNKKYKKNVHKCWTELKEWAVLKCVQMYCMSVLIWWIVVELNTKTYRSEAMNCRMWYGEITMKKWLQEGFPGVLMNATVESFSSNDDEL